MRYIPLFVALLLLTGCKPTEEQRTNVAAKLPSGCKIVDLGEYGSFDNLVVILCDGHQTQTMNMQWQKQCSKNTVCNKYGVSVLYS